MKRVVAFVLAVFALSSPALATPGDPYAPQYYFDQWHVPALWRSGARGQGVTIAEIDTGVDARLPALAGRVHSGRDFGRFGGRGWVDRDTHAYGHGTSMASIMVGRPGRFGIRGLAPDARVLPIAIPLAGTTDAAPDDHLADAIRWATEHGANIISMSLGGARRPTANRAACPPDEQQAIFAALRKGALVLAAVGNRAAHGDAIEEPGVCLGVVSVGAVDSSGAVASFSSRQPYLTITAPGADIASIGPGGRPFEGSGTSQATAIASAAAALAWSKFPRLTAAQLLGRLLATADHRGWGHSKGYGYGTIDLARAISARLPARLPDPVYAAARPFLDAPAGSSFAPPSPAPRDGRPPGQFAVRPVPRLSKPSVVVGIVLAAAGLLALTALIWSRVTKFGR